MTAARFKYFIKTANDLDPRVASCMRYAQPAIASVKGYCRAQRRREARGTKTTQVNARMATADHDRQGQAAHRQYKSRTVVEFASGKSMHNRHHKREKFSS